MRRELGPISLIRVVLTQIKNLNGRAMNFDGTGNRCERREVDLGRLRVRSGQF